MIKIYTADECKKSYGRCSAVVEGGYIYSANDLGLDMMGKFDRSKAIGKIDYQKSEIYGRDWNALFPRARTCFEKRNGEIYIYRLPKKHADSPVLIIEGNRLFTYEGRNKLFAQPCGYIENSGNTSRVGGDAADFGILYDIIIGGPKKDNGGMNLLGIVGSVALLIAFVYLVFALISEGARYTFSRIAFLAGHFPVMLVGIAMVIVLTVNLKKTFKRVNTSAQVKEACTRAALPVALKAMIIPVAAALLGMVINDQPAMFTMSIPWLILLFVYCWVVVSRMMQARLLDRQGRTHGKKAHSSLKKAWEKLLQKCKLLMKKKVKSPGYTGSATVERVLRPCPHCKAKCRVPAGKGRMTITCPLCHTRYQVRT